MILHIEPKNSFHLILNKEKETLKLKINMAYKANVYKHYDGGYIITPKITSQLLETKNKVMDDDVSIEEIYFNETENSSNGLTVQIGEI